MCQVSMFCTSFLFLLCSLSCVSCISPSCVSPGNTHIPVIARACYLLSLRGSVIPRHCEAFARGNPFLLMYCPTFHPGLVEGPFLCHRKGMPRPYGARNDERGAKRTVRSRKGFFAITQNDT